MRLIDPIAKGALCAIVTCFAVRCARGGPEDGGDPAAVATPLTAEERRTSLAVEKEAVKDKAAEFKPLHVVENRGDRRQYVTGVSLANPGEAAGPGERKAVVTRYQYEGGLTIRTTVDLQNKEALTVEPLANYPTPLAPEEIREAAEIARQQDEGVKALYAEHGPEAIKPQALVEVIADPKRADYGHRVARLTFKVGKRLLKVPPVAVDLTDRKVKGRASAAKPDAKPDAKPKSKPKTKQDGHNAEPGTEPGTRAGKGEQPDEAPPETDAEGPDRREPAPPAAEDER